ncbi:MAG: hypothetical protein EZS28_000304 [Streblomastix strix]|uniref:Uncharacterized protein n=1 Tax=Streblomastix strix TaxID=222440 RepID=A0A5J4XAE4_9EUKA|nr:MAG: hypothetical protein EZS28_000304 [Streblomastix strix]
MLMSACANIIKYDLAYSDFKLDQDYTSKDDYASVIREEIETQATTSQNPIVHSTENYFYRQDTKSAKHDSLAKILQHQTELTMTRVILQIT